MSKKKRVTGFSGNFYDYESQPYNLERMKSIAHLIETNGQRNVPSNRVFYFDLHKERYFWEMLEEK